MNNVIKVVMVCLLTFSSASMASSYSTTTTVSDAKGTFTLLNDNNVAFDAGVLSASNGYSVFYEVLNGGSQDAFAIGHGAGIYNRDVTLTYSLFSDYSVDATTGDITLLNEMSSNTGSLLFSLVGYQTAYLQVSADEQVGYSVTVSAVPVPAAGVLFATLLLSAGAVGRRKKKSANTLMVNAFTRTS